jgi:hypothetical protein
MRSIDDVLQKMIVDLFANHSVQLPETPDA